MCMRSPVCGKALSAPNQKKLPLVACNSISTITGPAQEALCACSLRRLPAAFKNCLVVLLSTSSAALSWSVLSAATPFWTLQPSRSTRATTAATHLSTGYCLLLSEHCYIINKVGHTHVKYASHLTAAGVSGALKARVYGVACCQQVCPSGCGQQWDCG